MASITARSRPSEKLGTHSTIREMGIEAEATMRLTRRRRDGSLFRMAEPRVHNVKPAYPGTQAVVRAVRLLKACAGHPAPRLGDLCRSQGLHKTTAYRLLSALESEGLLERTDDDAYRLGPEMVALGNQALGAPQLREAARRELDALRGGDPRDGDARGARR